ncbi:MAG: hypothetical protein DRI86_01680 [Bacteroidetes bacterium]|nr:MAG: hypothetical protein DRI86_01680 [Bacteroidota bacterium]
MIEIKEAVITNITVHRIGIQSDTSFLNDKEIMMNFEEDEEAIKRTFLKPFASSFATYEFRHDEDIELNPIFKISKEINEEADFVLKTKEIHQYLKDVSIHPNIKDGDLFVINFDNIKLENEHYKALGIYKVENKETFIETVAEDDGRVKLNFKKGVGRKLDKAILVLFTEEPYTVFVIDNGSVETDYWMNDFANVALRNDYVNNTTHFLEMTENFIKHKLPEEFDVERTDQIDLLNRSVDYFKTNDSFVQNEFEVEVLQDSNLIDTFHSYDEGYTHDKSINFDEGFEISNKAVKKQAKNFRSVLKLDKNFSIYMHGDKSLVERGVDENGKKYYKFFFDDEK